MKVNQRIKTLVGSTTLAITAKAKELKDQGKDVVNFAAGEPDFDTPEFIKEAAVVAIKKGFTKYTPSVGTLELRQSIAEKFKKDNNLTYTSNQIVVSCGAKHAIYDLIQVLTDEGDEVIFQSPYWVSYPEMVKLTGAKSKIVETTARNSFKMTAHDLESAVTKNTRVLLLNSPSNPTGVVYTKNELKAIADVCVKHNIFVISDEIYEKLIYSNEGHVSIASFGKEIYNLTATVNGVSKAYAMTGWRIGYCAAPQEVIDYVKKFQDHTTSNPSSISQMAALAALQASEETIKTMRDEFKKRRDVMMSSLDEIPGISYVRPEGAFYVFCDISKLKMKSAVFAERILNDANVALIPGDGFGAEGYVRLSFATSTERIKEGVRRIGEWVKKANSGNHNLAAAVK